MIVCVVKFLPNLSFETPFWDSNNLVCGIDEVGRGAFAGPLVAAGLVLQPIKDLDKISKLLSLKINDSKLLSEKKRREVLENAKDFILFSHVEFIPIEVINKEGIGFANKMGFLNVAHAIQNLAKNASMFFLTDAFKIPHVPQDKQKNIIRGDSTSISIALASILAKTERDNYMKKLADEFSLYGFEKHKGYGTLHHREMILKYGASIHHRTDFIASYIS